MTADVTDGFPIRRRLVIVTTSRGKKWRDVARSSDNGARLVSEALGGAVRINQTQLVSTYYVL